MSILLRSPNSRTLRFNLAAHPMKTRRFSNTLSAGTPTNITRRKPFPADVVRGSLIALVALLGLHLLAPQPAMAGAKKKKVDASVRFYVETDASGGETFGIKVKQLSTGKDTYMAKIPIVSERDIESVYLFTNPDGSMGASFMLSRHGQLSLQTESAENTGRYIFAFVNGRQVTDIFIDRQVFTSYISIMKGLTQQEQASLGAAFPPVGGAPDSK